MPHCFDELPVTVSVKIAEATPETDGAVEFVPPWQVTHVTPTWGEVGALTLGFRGGVCDEVFLIVDSGDFISRQGQGNAQTFVAAWNVKNAVAPSKAQNRTNKIHFLPGLIERFDVGQDIGPMTGEKGFPPL